MYVLFESHEKVLRCELRLHVEGEQSAVRYGLHRRLLVICRPEKSEEVEMQIGAQGQCFSADKAIVIACEHILVGFSIADDGIDVCNERIRRVPDVLYDAFGIGSVVSEEHIFLHRLVFVAHCISLCKHFHEATAQVTPVDGVAVEFHVYTVKRFLES